MGKTFTLDSFRQEVDRKYGPFVLEGVPGGGDIRFLPMLRHTRERRDEIGAVLDRHTTKQGTEEAPAETTDLNKSIADIEELLSLVLENRSDMTRLKTAFGDDGQLFMSLWSEYQEATQPGEAEHSES